eukprot:GHVU01208473.1.p1 GENE.GHVU01208473.1~~GHVU01208473.1.p1  ORF type:complete len:668 (+),score=68.59 GHVU01208473.1:414-2417(+)
MHPNHAMPLDVERRPIVQAALATEVKCFLATTHCVRDGVSPMRLIAARPQSTNECTKPYNVEVVNAVERCPDVTLVSVAFDGLSSDSAYVRDGLVEFLVGKRSSVFLLDPNHAAKALRSQLVLGSRVVTLGRHLVDPGLLAVAGVKKELVAVSDFTSDVVVLELCSEETLNKLEAIVKHEEQANVVVTALSLFFLRCFLIAVNTKLAVSSKDRAAMLWACLCWMTSLHGVHYTTRQNVATSIIGSVCLVFQKGVTTRLCTTEPLEHFFGFMRCWRREFTVKDLTERASKLETTFTNMMTHGVIPGSAKQGYMCGFASYNRQVQQMRKKQGGGEETGRAAASSSGAGDCVDVNYDGCSDGQGQSVAEQIQAPLLETIKWVSESMGRLLKNFGCSAADMSPFCRSFSDTKELASVYLEYLARDHKAKPRGRGATGATTAADRAEEADTEVTTGDVSKDEEIDNLGPILTNLQESLCGADSTVEPEPEAVPEARPTAEKSVNDGVDLSALYDLLWLQQDELMGSKAFFLAKECLSACQLKRQGGRTDALLKAKSLAGRWWSTVREAEGESNSVLPVVTGSARHILKRNDVFLLEGKHVRILSVYQYSYKKWRMVQSGESTRATKVHFAMVKTVYDRLSEDSDLGVEERYQVDFGTRFNSARLVTRVSEML